MKLKILLLLVCTHAVLAAIHEEQYEVNTGFKVRTTKGELKEVTLSDRTLCGTGDIPPPNRHNTSVQVDNLIIGMSGRGYDAYVVPSSDEHQNEYTAISDERRQYISGFTGSSGTAVILSNGTRALWTDGRYFLQADEELDCSWLFMKDEMEGVPTISEWLVSSLSPGSVVSADARLIGSSSWISFKTYLEDNGLSLVVDSINNGNDLLDEQWNADGRPPLIRNEAYVHEVKFAGKTWQDKVADVEAEMTSYEADAFVVTALDEVAWLLNLRGSDIPYNPVFQSYAIIQKVSGSPSNVILFLDGNLTTQAVNQLGIGNCNLVDPCVSTQSNNLIGSVITSIDSDANVNSIMISSKFSKSEGASYYIYDLISDNKRALYPSPTLLMKAQKNQVEQDGMRNAHIKDATALISFLAFIEQQITSGQSWTEMQAQQMLDSYRFLQEDNMGLSFNTISAFGPNGAVIHYSATPETDTLITDQSLYLLDSGGQYLDGTTDVTRTLHFGTPNAKQIDAYTRVIMGVIDFASAVIPKGTGKSYTDVLGRRALYEVGLDYRHGTSHGVGMFLNVHESSDIVYELGYCSSDEPGYYEDGQWGIRVENVIMSVDTTTKYDFSPVSYAFETLTLVPFEQKLLDLTMLDIYQCEFLNAYNIKIRNVMGPVLAVQNINGYNYMMAKTNYSC